MHKEATRQIYWNLDTTEKIVWSGNCTGKRSIIRSHSRWTLEHNSELYASYNGKTTNSKLFLLLDSWYTNEICFKLSHLVTDLSTHDLNWQRPLNMHHDKCHNLFQTQLLYRRSIFKFFHSIKQHRNKFIETIVGFMQIVIRWLYDTLNVLHIKPIAIWIVN